MPDIGVSPRGSVFTEALAADVIVGCGVNLEGDPFWNGALLWFTGLAAGVFSPLMTGSDGRTDGPGNLGLERVSLEGYC